MKHAQRWYKCPLCGHTQQIGTNHLGSTWSGCKNCRQEMMVCIEPEAVAARESIATINTTIHTFSFDLGVQEELETYSNLMLRNQVHVFDVWAPAYGVVKRTLALDGKIISLYTDYFFNDQWNTNFGRFHDFCVWNFPNKSLRKGYYLDITEEMEHLRWQHSKCAYCGTILPNGHTCDKYKTECSEYGMQSLKTRMKK